MSRIDGDKLTGSLNEETKSQLEDFEIFDTIDSTNTHLLKQPPPSAGRLRIAIADEQTAGRGRYQRQWLSPPGSGLCLSVAYTFAESPKQLSALTLALGVGIVQALRALQIDGIALKWPNDLVTNQGKLGGILTELHSRRESGITVVGGLGLNVSLPDGFIWRQESMGAHRPVDLASLCVEHPPREIVAAEIMNRVFSTLCEFAVSGLAAFLTPWRELDWLRGRTVTAERPTGMLTGKASGIDDSGALLIDTDSEVISVSSGSVTIATNPAGGS